MRSIVDWMTRDIGTIPSRIFLCLLVLLLIGLILFVSHTVYSHPVCINTKEIRRTRTVISETGGRIDRFQEKQRRLPSSLAELSSFDTKEIPTDGWGQPLLYEVRGNYFALVSAGRDRRIGTKDDLTN